MVIFGYKIRMNFDAQNLPDDAVRIPMKTATHSDPFRPLIPIQSGHFGAWSVWRG